MLMILFIGLGILVNLARCSETIVIEKANGDESSCPDWLLEAWKKGLIHSAEVGGTYVVGDADIESKYPQKAWRSTNPALDADWESWKKTFKKYYFTKHEEQIRRLFWEDNKALVDAHNRMFEKGGVTFKMHLTQFSDLSEHEYRNMHGLTNK